MRPSLSTRKASYLIGAKSESVVLYCLDRSLSKAVIPRSWGTDRPETRSLFYGIMCRVNGEVAEWSKAPVSKTGTWETASRVRISSSPQKIKTSPGKCPAFSGAGLYCQNEVLWSYVRFGQFPSYCRSLAGHSRPRGQCHSHRLQIRSRVHIRIQCHVF